MLSTGIPGRCPENPLRTGLAPENRNCPIDQPTAGGAVPSRARRSTRAHLRVGAFHCPRHAQSVTSTAE